MTRSSDVLSAAAALMGAAGVALAAGAAHGGGGEFGKTAAEFLILHAAALMGVGGQARNASPRRAGLLLVTGSGLALGTLLFSGDLARLGFEGARLFPYAAPIGGSLMILAWIALAITFLLAE